MRTALDFTPFYRSTVGFEPFFDLLERASRLDVAASWPPYDVERTGESGYRISMAVAGFGPDDVEVTQHGNTLLITGRRGGEAQGRQLLHRGLAFRDFEQSFRLADHVRVEAADLKDGVLKIELVREVPESLKPRRIPIAGIEATGIEASRAPETPRTIEATAPEVSKAA